MLTGLHVLLTYRCPYRCDHCFLFCGPNRSATFTRTSLLSLIDDARSLGTIRDLYFEGGEPFLYYPLLLEGVRAGRDAGFDVGIVTNSYWAVTESDAELWLRPLVEAGLQSITVSSDEYHSGAGGDPRPGYVVAAALRLGIRSGTICIPPPDATDGVRFRGRAAEQLTQGLPLESGGTFDKCPDEDLRDPGRVHVDPHGNVHLCQGLLMGNAFERPLAELLDEWRPEDHPAAGPLATGGPAELAKAAGMPDARAVSACHLCFSARVAMRDRHPDALGPPEVYGEEPG